VRCPSAAEAAFLVEDDGTAEQLAEKSEIGSEYPKNRVSKPSLYLHGSLLGHPGAIQFSESLENCFFPQAVKPCPFKGWASSPPLFAEFTTAQLEAVPLQVKGYHLRRERHSSAVVSHISVGQVPETYS